MSDLAIRVQDISKQYFIGGPQKVYTRLGDQIVDILKSPFSRAANLIRGRASSAAALEETIWAIRDVSFEINHGEVVGIIGQNGAGKSTLLKILSQITEPTRGFADIFGRVGSLLEVGTGFHPELTGRENIYLNGAILGMGKAEIESKFDEIVSFSEIEKFIDTPVKHYSSGMYVRLAFSVAAHLEPEILLVDEVLAVGDVSFQRKCLGKMGSVGQQGRTVLFVSHNMGLLLALCRRGIFLQDGRIVADGPIDEVVDRYLGSLEKIEKMDLTTRTDRKGQGKARLVGVKILGGKNGDSEIIKSGEPLRFIFQVNRYFPGMYCEVSIYDSVGQPVMRLVSKIYGPQDIQDPENRSQFSCEIDQLLLLPGRYRLDVAIIDNQLQDFLQAASYFDVSEGLINGRPVIPDKKFHLSMPHRWTSPG